MQSQMQTKQTHLFQISQTQTAIILMIKLTDTTIKTINQKLNQFEFESINFKGKYPQLKYGYNQNSKTAVIKMNKKYFFNILNYKKYELLVFSKGCQNIFEEFLSNTLCSFVQNRIFVTGMCKIVHVDLFSLTIMKDFNIVNCKNNYQTKRFFVKVSSFYFRRSPFMRNRQSEQILAGICRSVNKPQQKKQFKYNYQMIEEVQEEQEQQKSNQGQMEQQVSQNIDIPTDEEFLTSPRIAFLDQLFANELFTKRFCPRFFTFYQAHNLFMGTTPLQHKFIKQFYQKVGSRCVMNSLRLKKMSFHFKIPTEQKNIKIGLYLSCAQDQNNQIANTANTQQQQMMRENNGSTYSYNYKEALPFTLEVLPENQASQKYTNLNISDSFIKHLYESVSSQLNYIQNAMKNQPNNPTHYQDHSFIELATNTTTNQKIFRPINQVGFCRILCQFSFFMDRIIFRNSNSNSKMAFQAQQSNPKDCSTVYKLPLSQQYKLKKYAYQYCVQIKSTYNYPNITGPNLLNSMSLGVANHDEYKLKHPYENTINKIVMYRKKVAKELKDNAFDSLEFPINTNIELVKGLFVYVNQVLKKWNVSDSYYDINNFVAGYLNIIVDKYRDKNQKNSYFKTGMNWKQVIDGLSALIQALTRSFSSPDTTIILHILTTYEDNRNNEQIIKNQVSQGEQIMLMTFKLLRITQAGWLEVIPSCQYYFQMQKDQTIVSTNNDKVEKEQISIKWTKEQIEKTFRSYLQKTMKSKYELPLPYYDRK